MTYEDAKEFVDGCRAVFYQNQDGEFTEVHPGRNKDGEYVRFVTFQNNGWMRTNVYYQDGSSDEMYRRQK